MPAYLIVRADVKDMGQYREYTKVTPEIVARYGGQFIVRGGNTLTLEGPDETRRIVVIEFPSFEKAVECYRSPEYTAAKKIREGINTLTGCDVAVIISDTHGRPLRKGEMNVAIGVAGIQPLRDRRGESDLFGYVLRVKETEVVDELASAAELVIGQADEGIPVAIIRGYTYQEAANAKTADLIRPKEEDLFL